MPARIIAEFLTGHNLRKMFSHLCNNASGQVQPCQPSNLAYANAALPTEQPAISQVTDPISDTAVMMMMCPVQLILTEVGVALFKDRPTSLYPFSHMDANQRYFVEEVVRDCLMHCDITTRSFSSARDLDLPYYHLHHHAVVQMGGGCILYTHALHPAEALEKPPPAAAKKKRLLSLQENQPAAGTHLRLRAEDVLKSMCDCIFASTKYGDANVRLAICSILLQRIVGMCGSGVVSREDQRAMHQYCEDSVKEWRARDAAAAAEAPKSI